MKRFIITCLITASAIAHAADTYVAKPGGFSETNPTQGQEVIWKPGTADAVPNLIFGTDAFHTITEAVEAVDPGETIYIAAGNYAEGNVIVAEDSVNFVGDGPGLTVIDGAMSHSIFELNGSATIKDLTIQNGSGDSIAAGISSFGQDLVLENIHFFNNQNTSGSVGALFVSIPQQAQGPGGGHLVRIEGCLFDENAGDTSCILHEGDFSGQEFSEVFIANTTFSSNLDLAIESVGGTLILTQCTFYDNPSGAFDAAGGVETPESDVILINSLVLDSYNAPFITSNGTNFLAVDSIGAGDLTYSTTFTTDPAELIDLALSDNGGATATHKLAVNSPLINAATNVDAVDPLGIPLLFDQRGSGFPRISDGTVDIGAFENLAPTLTLSIEDFAISEDPDSEIPSTTTVTVSRNTDTTNALTVTLSSDDTSEATIPANLTIPAGQTSAMVTLTAVDDAIVDGTQTVTISASAAGFIGDSGQVDVIDDDFPTQTYVAKPGPGGGFSVENPVTGQEVIWKPGTPDEVTGLIFGLDAFTSINDATMATEEEGTVYIAAGNYTEGSEIFVPKDLNFRGDGPGLTVIDGATSHSLFFLDGETTITDLTIQDGLGGISAYGSELTLRNVHFFNNIDALLILSFGEQEAEPTPQIVNIEGCLFSDNTTQEGESSCIYHESRNLAGSDLIIANTTFSSNQGPAIRSLSGVLAMIQCTFYDNQSGAFDTSDDMQIGLGSNVFLINSLVLDSFVAPNISSNGRNFLAVDSIDAGDLTYDNTAATVPSDLIDLALSDNGGPTATHKLSANSVAINAGRNEDATDMLGNPFEFDQRGEGFPRISQGTVDIGAFEVFAPTLTLSILDSSISENAGTSASTVTVTRNTDTTNALTVTLSSDDTSEATVPTTITILAGETSVTADLDAVDDTIVDGTQTVTITASANGFIPGSGTVDVTDDDFATLTVSIAAATIPENGGTTTVTITRNTDPDETLTIDLFSDNEFEAIVPAMATFNPGETSTTVNVTAVDDDIVDGTQTVTITASGELFQVDATDTVDVTDNDLETLTVSIDAATISENGGPSAATVTITRNTDPFINLDVTLSSDDVTEAIIQTIVSFGPEQSSVTVPLSAVDDNFADGTQTVTITASANGFISGTDTVDVTDDDVATLTVSIAAATIPENGGTTTVTITRNTDPDETLTIDLFSDNEFEAIVPALATFNPGEISTTVNVTAVDDDIVDGTQTVTITASGELFQADATDTVDVTDNDVAALTISIDDPEITEDPNSQIPNSTTVTITRNTGFFDNLEVTLSSDDTSQAILPPTISFTPEQSSVTVSLTAVDDLIADGTQTVTVTASADGFAAGTDTVDVLDDDVATLTLTIIAPEISEDPASQIGNTTTVTVSRNTDTTNALTAGLLSSDISEATVPSATLTIPAGADSATFILTAVDDTELDGTQTVTVTASASGFTPGADTVDVTDDEVPALTLSIADTSISENGGTTTVTVTRNTETETALDVTLLSGNESDATLPATLTIPSGQASASAILSAVDNTSDDGDRIVGITANASGFAEGTGQILIIDDDGLTLSLAIAEPSISENSGSTTVTVSHNADTTNALTVGLLSSDISEATVPSATLTIPAGADSATFDLTAVDDDIVDGTQTVTITASATGFTPGADTVDVTDDDGLQITLEGGGTLNEPNSFSSSPLSPSETNLILRRNGTLGDIAVNLAIASGSRAEIGNDFTINGAASPTFAVTIPDGESEVAIPVQALDDMAAEVDETFVVLLLPGSFVSGNTSVSVSIAQNDYGVTSLEDSISPTAPTAEEGTLRLAILNAKAGLTIADDAPPSDPVIIFRPDLTGEIKLIAGAFQLDQVSFSIIGPGSQQVSISGEDASSIFFVSDPERDLTYSISGLTMSGGFSSTYGGAIFSDESLLLSNCVLSECAADIGGAISNEGSLELDNCTFFNNTATTYGGAIDNFSGTLSLRGCTIAENQAEFGGGIENSEGSELWVDSSTFFRNRAGASGGAIDSFGAFTNISNTTISGNQAGFGAGIFNEQGTLRIWQSTIVKNAAVTSVGGILTSVTTPVSTTLHNTIVAGNTQSGSPSDLSTNNPSFAKVTPSSSNNLIGHANTAGGLLNGIKGNIVGGGATNIFRPLGDNGGPTFTHALLPGSRAINAGNPAFALDSEGLPLTTDQRGFPRFVFTTNDIGAYEASENPISIVSIDANPGVSATIRWTSESGLSYDVMRSTDLKTFETIETGITAVGGITSFTDNDPPLERAFYVIRSSTSE